MHERFDNTHLKYLLPGFRDQRIAEWVYSKRNVFIIIVLGSILVY